MLPLLPVLLIVGYVVAVVILICIVAMWSRVLRFISEKRLEKRLRQFGRLITLNDEVSGRLVESGTFIIEWPDLGWNNSRLWWTSECPEQLLAIAPPSDDQRHETIESEAVCLWDVWCWQEFLSVRCGRAKLLRSWSGKSLLERLRRTHPDLKSVTVNTGLAFIMWDREVEHDVASGRLDAIDGEAINDYREGRSTGL